MAKAGSGPVRASLEMGLTAADREWALAISCRPGDAAESAPHRCNVTWTQRGGLDEQGTVPTHWDGGWL